MERVRGRHHKQGHAPFSGSAARARLIGIDANVFEVLCHFRHCFGPIFARHDGSIVALSQLVVLDDNCLPLTKRCDLCASLLVEFIIVLRTDEPSQDPMRAR